MTIPPTLDTTVGALFTGVIVSSISFGITCLEAYTYYHCYPRDMLLHKLSVGILWTLDTSHLLLIVYTVYNYLVTNFGNVQEIIQIPWSLKLATSVNVAIIIIVQSLYTLRVWKLCGHHRGFLGYVLAFVVASGSGVGIALAYSTWTCTTFLQLGSFSLLICVAFGMATTIDLAIAYAMCHYLRKSRLPTARFNSNISAMMQYAVSSGVLTSFCSFSSLVSYALMPNNFVFLGIQFFLTKVYVSSFLAMLNARERHDVTGRNGGPLNPPNISKDRPSISDAPSSPTADIPYVRR